MINYLLFLFHVLLHVKYLGLILFVFSNFFNFLFSKMPMPAFLSTVNSEELGFFFFDHFFPLSIFFVKQQRKKLQMQWCNTLIKWGSMVDMLPENCTP